jgi:hypothetical protein
MSTKFPMLNYMSVKELVHLSALTIDSQDKSDMEFTDEIRKELKNRVEHPE